MSFYLNIECSKDIDVLHIDFSDGSSSVVTSKSPNDKPPKQETKKRRDKDTQQPTQEKKVKADVPLDLDVDYDINQEVVQKPEIQEVDRPIKVAEELQNFDF